MYNPALHAITVLEAVEIAIGSSGKGGGFIASWAIPKCIAPLSFKLHESLAKEHDGEKRWGFRTVHAAEIKLQSRSGNQSAIEFDSAQYPRALDWLYPGSVTGYKEIGSPKDSGQIHPHLFTKALAGFAEERKVRVILGSAKAIGYSEDGSAVKSVTYVDKDTDSETTLDVTDVVVAAGPWSSKLLPKIKLFAPKGHSIVVRPSRDISPYILFPHILPSSLLSPDIYPRPRDPMNDFDTVYSSGPDSHNDTLPELASDVVVEDEKCEDVWTAVKSVTSSEVADGEVITRQACYKAQIRKHEEDEETGPMVGPMDVSGLWLATGLDEWGVQNGPAVGLVMSEMILEGKAKSANVEKLDPKHWL